MCVGFPALAEIDLSGSWALHQHEDSMERGAGPNPADWAGLPFNEAGRAKALSLSTIDHLHAGAHLLVPDPVAHRGRAVQPQDVGRARSPDGKSPWRGWSAPGKRARP